jgi:hypothetical protein
MPTAQSASKVRQPAKRASSASGPDAVALLKKDHAEVKALFKEYDRVHLRLSTREHRCALL